MSWVDMLEGPRRQATAARLVTYANQRRWFRGKSLKITDRHVVDEIPLDGPTLNDAANVLLIAEVHYEAAAPDLYIVPLARAAPDAIPALRAERPEALIDGGDDGLVDGLATGSAAAAFFDLAHTGGTRRGRHGELVGERSELFSRVVPAAGAAALGLRVAGVEQTNSTVIFGDRAILKAYRQLTVGPNPELEMGRFLGQACDPPCVPRVLGALTYRADDGRTCSVAIIHELVANHGDAWALAQRELARMFQAGGSRERFLALAKVLGQRTAELHLALAGRRGTVAGAGPDFAPEPLTADDRRLLADRTRHMFENTLASLSGSAGRGLPADARALADQLLAPAGRAAIERLLVAFRDLPLEAVKTRTHGDLHLGQVLSVAREKPSQPGDEAIDDFVIIDFEGEPARPLYERRAKGSPLRDVMGMVRSFDYAPEAALRGGVRGASADGRAWTREVTDAYLGAYLDGVRDAPFIPRDRAQLQRMLRYYELEKVVYEVGYELNNRPTWLEIPLRGLLAVAELESGS
jgi:maltose alpha-D-glucosyltransferase/alpha-amylase